jgi:membrane fusion protein, heavy metal efflux system
MSERTRFELGWPAAVATGALLIAGGALATYLALRPHSASTAQPMPASTERSAASGARPDAPVNAAPPPGAATTTARLEDIVVPIGPEMMARAGIVVGQVTSGQTSGVRRLPAVVEANAYKKVEVHPVVGGRVDRVLAELGQRVERGQPLAEVFSPDASEAESRYVAARASLEAHERELQRTEKLVGIGAASRQELERLHAEHAARLTEVESTRSRLVLLGVPGDAIEKLAPGGRLDAVAVIRAPLAGVVTERGANAGLIVDPSAVLFTIADLSTVWVVADLPEQDFALVRQGAKARLTVGGAAAREGVVSYIDPEVNPQTRTARLRVEVANRDSALRLGMFVDVDVDTASNAVAPLVPRSAIQRVGDRTVVYLAPPGQTGEFIEREVRVAESAGDEIPVLEGLKAGDAVVVDGSFAVRAERERLGLRPAGSTTRVSQPASESAAAPGPSTPRIVITERGFEPSSLTLPAGARASITFLRTTDQTCATEIVFPSLNIRRPLPLNQPVTIDVTVPGSGSLAFQCGMNMLKGTLVASTAP